MPLERRVDVVSGAPPNDGNVPRVVQLHPVRFVVVPPVHGPGEYVRFAIVAPDESGVHAVQLVGQPDRRQRFRISGQVIVAVEYVILATCEAI